MSAKQIMNRGYKPFLLLLYHFTVDLDGCSLRIGEARRKSKKKVLKKNCKKILSLIKATSI